jgi:hypothetical protein
VRVVSWTQAVCDDCWDERNPDRLSPHLGAGYRERCSWCGTCTVSGIYVREDPASVPFPADDTVPPELTLDDIRAIATEVCDLWDDDAVDDDAMSNLIVRLRKAIA